MSKKIYVFILCTFFLHVFANPGEDYSWTFGSAVDITHGPDNAVYCRIRNPADEVVFEGFGPCKIVVDRVTKDHEGIWTTNIGKPDRSVTTLETFTVTVVAPIPDDIPELIVTTNVFVNESVTELTCFVPSDYEVQACKFRDPRDPTFILVATKPVLLSGNTNYDGSFKSTVDANMCSVTILSTVTHWNQGIWRCAVETDNGTHYGFLTVEAPWTTPPSHPIVSDVSTVPRLKMRRNSYNVTEGDRPELFCYVDAPLRYCFFTAPNGTIYNVGPDVSSPDYEYVGNGFEAGDCGVRFRGMQTSDSGRWQCSLGLRNTTAAEERGNFSVAVTGKMLVSALYSFNNAIRVEGRPYMDVEYCRFIRRDGFGFTVENQPPAYNVLDPCTLHIANPTLLDRHPWTVTAKILGTGELVVGRSTQNLLIRQSSAVSVIGAMFFWFCILFICVMILTSAVALIPKKNRERTYARAARVRNSFRRNTDEANKPPPSYENAVNNTQPNV